MHFRECGGGGRGGEREGEGKEGGGQASGVLRASNPAFSDITVGPLYSLATFPECLPPAYPSVHTGRVFGQYGWKYKIQVTIRMRKLYKAPLKDSFGVLKAPIIVAQGKL